MTSKQRIKMQVFTYLLWSLPCLLYSQNATDHAVLSQGSGSTLNPDNTCLANKNFGKNLSAADLETLSSRYNAQSPFSFGSMIGLNDGGLVFRSFQGVSNNQITQLTTQFRNFHTMDQDFDNTLGSYGQNIKPKDTSPEGTPAYMSYNKNLYNIYRTIHGFTDIVAATEILQYGNQSWKEKIYLESDWSKLGPAGIRTSFENYTRKFIDEMAPPNGANSQILVKYFQVGNELWDYPIKSDYHDLVIGARNAFVSKYGPKSNGGWKMKLAIGAFQAYRDNTCASALRNYSNCSGGLERHDFIGDYLDLPDCDALKDLDAIDCHPYSFSRGTLSWTYPEDPNSESLQISNLAGWRDANKNNQTGVLVNARLWSSEYGYDSNPVTGVGEKTQSAYLIRGLILHSRYHYEKVFFYNAFDLVKENNAYYNSLYNSTGFWKVGTHPLNNAWASPLIEHGATAKPSWFGMMDFKNRFGSHVFYKALLEKEDAYVYLIAKPDGSDPYLLFWSPKQTNDSNINTDIPYNQVLNWTEFLPGNYKPGTEMGQVFASTAAAGQTFKALTGIDCGTTTLTAIRRNPTFVPLVSCAPISLCNNVQYSGLIVAPNPSIGYAPFTPTPITNGANAGGGNGGAVVYQWQKSSNGLNFVDILGATAITYAPLSLQQTTYFRRGGKRPDCIDFLYTAAVKIEVATGNCPNNFALKRIQHTNTGCNANGDYFFEISMNNIVANEKILLEGLPTSGINMNMSSLNNQFLNASTFNTNVQYINPSSMRWIINAGNGSSQKLKIYYCWSNYPNPVSTTTATSMCSGLKISCVTAFNQPDPDGEDRNMDMAAAQPLADMFRLSVSPNPGSDSFEITYSGEASASAHLRILSSAGQMVAEQHFDDLQDQQQWSMDTYGWTSGIYFVSLQTSYGRKHLRWVKY